MSNTKYQLPGSNNLYVDLVDDEDVKLMFDEWAEYLEAEGKGARSAKLHIYIDYQSSSSKRTTADTGTIACEMTPSACDRTSSACCLATTAVLTQAPLYQTAYVHRSSYRMSTCAHSIGLVSCCVMSDVVCKHSLSRASVCNNCCSGHESSMLVWCYYKVLPSSFADIAGNATRCKPAFSVSIACAEESLCCS